MNIELIICILLGILLALSTWMAGEFWKEKEHYRCRVFDLTNGKEGSHLPKAPDIPPPPAPVGMFPTRPLLTEWLHNNCGEYFRRKDVVALTKNPNRTINVVLGNGHTINTGLELDDLKEVLAISFSCSVNEELAHRKKMYKKKDRRMSKVVHNACFGGFCISLTAMKWLAENGRDEIKAIAEKNLREYPEQDIGFHCWDIERHDPDLVRCVETLGYKANGRFANLEVRELEGNRYRIAEYDGKEEVYEPEDENYITIE